MKVSAQPNGLLAPNDPPPVRIAGDPLAPSPFVLVGDHAGNAVPRALDRLGLPPSELVRHIGIDIGVEELGLALSERLQAPFVRQVYSRLVIDCNRDPAHATAMAAVSDGTTVPGNFPLDAAARALRVEAIFEPYHRMIADVLDRRIAAGLATILVSLHSFTPAMSGFQRPWDVGVLHSGGRDEFALCLLERLQREPRLTVGDNEPYALGATDYTVPHHAFNRELPYLELEVRQDLIGPQRARLTRLLAQTFKECAVSGGVLSPRD